MTDNDNIDEIKDEKGFLLYNAPFQNKTKDKWIVLKTNMSGEKSVHEFDSLIDAEKWIITDTNDEKITGDNYTAAVDNLKRIGETYIENSPQNQIIHEADMTLVQYRQHFAKKKKDILEKSCSLIRSMGEILLDAGGDVDESITDFIESKVSIDSMSMSSMLIQLETSRMGIERLCEKIHLGDYNSKTFEALSSMQNIVLQVTKYQSEFVSNITKDYLEFKQMIQEYKANNIIIKQTDNEEHEDAIVFTTNDKIKLSKQTKQMMEEIESIIRIPSGNMRLRKDDDDNSMVDEVTDGLTADNMSSDNDGEINNDIYITNEEGTWE